MLSYSSVPVFLLEGLTAILSWISDNLEHAQDYERMLSTIFGALMVKCLVMWAHDDCRWGAGSEHKVAYALSEHANRQLLHGEACAFGTWLMCSLFFRDSLGEKRLELLRDVLQRVGLPLTCNLAGIDKSQLPLLLGRARMYRPGRQSYLDILSDDILAKSDYGGL
jgi:glycerol dehydrogenase-like iron-containing ADH family enzyme